MDVGHIEQSNVASGLCARIWSCYCGPELGSFWTLTAAVIWVGSLGLLVYMIDELVSYHMGPVGIAWVNDLVTGVL